MASLSGPNEVTVARTGAPDTFSSMPPPSRRNWHGNAVGAQSSSTAVDREVTRSDVSPATDMPVKSPFTSARNTGTPAADSCSAIPCRVLVLPVPVAPATSPCRFIIDSGNRTWVPMSVWPPSDAAPSTSAGPCTW